MCFSCHKQNNHSSGADKEAIAFAELMESTGCSQLVIVEFVENGFLL